MKFSIISPIFRAENTVVELISRITNTVSQITDDFEIILIDDFSPDKSWDTIQQVASDNEHVIGIKLSRNFGQHYAITAGLDHATGDWVVVMDCDLQDQPEEIIPLYNKAMEGFDIVQASRTERQDSFSKRLSSILFYKVLSYLTGTKHDPSIANFGIYKKEVIQAISKLREAVRYFPTMVSWVGFKSTNISVTHSERSDGGSTYTFTKLLRLSLDIILANSDKPMKLTIKLGLSITIITFLFAIITLIRYFLGHILVQGYLSVILSICFFSGIIITTMGIFGLYIGKIFEGVKNRPIYLVEKIVKYND